MDFNDLFVKILKDMLIVIENQDYAIRQLQERMSIALNNQEDAIRQLEARVSLLEAKTSYVQRKHWPDWETLTYPPTRTTFTRSTPDLKAARSDLDVVDGRDM